MPNHSSVYSMDTRNVFNVFCVFMSPMNDSIMQSNHALTGCLHTIEQTLNVIPIIDRNHTIRPREASWPMRVASRHLIAVTILAFISESASTAYMCVAFCDL